MPRAEMVFGGLPEDAHAARAGPGRQQAAGPQTGANRRISIIVMNRDAEDATVLKGRRMRKTTTCQSAADMSKMTRSLRRRAPAASA